MNRSIWTLVTVAALALYAIFNALALLGYSPSAGSVAAVMGLYLYGALAVVAWMQTRWGALLVVGVGILVFVADLISASMYLYPQYGTQTEQYLYAPTNLLISLFAFLSYRTITRAG